MKDRIERTRRFKEEQSSIYPGWSGTHGAREVITLEHSKRDRLWNIKAYSQGGLIVDLHYGSDVIGGIWEDIKKDLHFFVYQNDFE